MDATVSVYPLYMVAAAEEDWIGKVIDKTTFALDPDVRRIADCCSVVDVIAAMVAVGVIPLIGTVAPAIIFC